LLPRLSWSAWGSDQVSVVLFASQVVPLWKSRHQHEPRAPLILILMLTPQPCDLELISLFCHLRTRLAGVELFNTVTVSLRRLNPNTREDKSWLPQEHQVARLVRWTIRTLESREGKDYGSQREKNDLSFGLSLHSLRDQR